MHKAKFVALFIVVGLAFIYGMGIGTSSLREPDTCFLLAMGRWICEHKSLPVTDPFSYTFAMFPNPYGLVVYQWLTEVIFFILAKVAGTAGLIIFTCIILVYSLIIMPWRILDFLKSGTLRAGLIAAGVALGSIDRMLLKPEMFSYFFLSLFLEAIVREEKKSLPRPLNWKLIAALSIYILLWANLHSGFVIGIILVMILAMKDLSLAFYCRVFKHNEEHSFLSTWLMSGITCLIASLATPYGIRLWQYIPHLYFHPANHYIDELQPLSISFVTHNLPLLCSFAGLSFLALLRIRRGFQPKLSETDVIYILMALTGVGLGLLFRRLIIFALLLMLPLIGSGFSIKASTLSISGIGRKRIFVLMMLSAIAGGLCVVFLTNPSLPAVSKAFVPPFQALQHITPGEAKGNLFNDPEFGDVLLWNLAKPPKLFIDTRFDAYPWQVEQDYMTIRDCQPAWRELLTKYKINWIFSPPSTTLCHQLEADYQWRILFKDKYSEILVCKTRHQG